MKIGFDMKESENVKSLLCFEDLCNEDMVLGSFFCMSE